MRHSYQLGRDRSAAWALALFLIVALALLLPSLVSAADKVLLTGSITGADALAPLGGVTVDEFKFDGANYQWVGTTTTGSDGAYIVYGSVPGDYRFVYAAGGRVSQTYDVTWNGGAPLTHDVALASAKLIAQGTVTYAGTGANVTGAHVQAYWSNGSSYEWVGEAYSRADGWYVLYETEARGPGEYRFSVNVPGHWLQSVDTNWDGAAVLSVGFVVVAVGPDAYEPDDTFEQSKSIVVGGPSQERSIYPLGDHDWVTFQALAGTTYVIETQPSANSITDTYLYLYAEGTALEDDNGGASSFSRIVWSCTADQTVFLMVRNANDGASWGPYVLSVTELPNTPPIAYDDSYEATQGTLLSVPASEGVLANDYDADGDTLWPEVVAWPGHGALSLGDDGSFTYQPSPGFVGEDTFTYAVFDGESASIPATVTITVVARPAQPLYSTIRGADRYQTAVQISKAAYPSGAPVVFLVKGDNYPDALAAGPLAAAYGGPIMITPSTGLNDTVRQELKRLAPGTVFVIGLPVALNAQVKAALPGLTDSDLHEIRGTDRYHTATLIADELLAKRGSVARVVLVAGDNFPDALSVGPLAAKQGWAVLLTPQKGPLPAVTRQKILDLKVTKALRVGNWVGLPARVTPTDLVGVDRYHTSALVAEYGKAFGVTFEHIALVKGDNYPDALVVGPYLEGVSGTVLLTAQTALPSRIVTLLEGNISTVRICDIVGLPAAISTEMETRFPPSVPTG